jgi:hypothetical protein
MHIGSKNATLSTATLAVHISIFGDWRRRRSPDSLAGMHPALRAIADANHGVVDRTAALAVVDHSVLERAVLTGRLTRPFPRTYLDGERANDRRALVHAALAYASGKATLSHLSALEVWGLPAPESTTVHLLTNDRHHLRGAVGLRVHRRRGLRLEAPDVLIRNGFPVTRLEQTIVDCWPLLDGDAQRAPAIHAVAGWMTRPERLAEALDNAPRLAGRCRLVRLIELLRAGCRSELELWGYETVFAGPEFASLKWQVPIAVAGRTIYLDALDPDSGVNFELDGRNGHSSHRDRERDLRRDAAVQALGIAVVRLSRRRLTHEGPAIRREALAIMAARREAWRTRS